MFPSPNGGREGYDRKPAKKSGGSYGKGGGKAGPKDKPKDKNGSGSGDKQGECHHVTTSVSIVSDDPGGMPAPTPRPSGWTPSRRPLGSPSSPKTDSRN